MEPLLQTISHALGAALMCRGLPIAEPPLARCLVLSDIADAVKCKLRVAYQSIRHSQLLLAAPCASVTCTVLTPPPLCS